MNKVFLIGNLTRDPELSETQAGTAVCRFGIAVNRKVDSEGERKADFYNVTAWRGLAESFARYRKKGDKVAIVGNIEQRTYEDREGVTKTVYDVIATEIEFLNSAKSDNSNTETPAKETTTTTEKRKPTLQAFDDDGDIPF